MKEVKTMPQFVDIGVELQAEFVGGCAADAGMEHGATLTLFALLIEHNAIQACAHLVQLADHLPDGPLRHVLPEAEVPEHRGVEFGVTPSCVSGLADINDIASGRWGHFNPCF